VFSIECIDDCWHVCRGDIIVSPGYRFKEMAERELSYRIVEQYRILISVEGGYHPQWRWNSEWGWAHFKHRVNNAYVVFKSQAEAEQFMAEQEITQYDTVQEDRTA
jgi:hypothetical protein